MCSNIDGPRDYCAKQSINESKRERQMQYDATYMWNLKHNTNQLIYKTKTDSQVQKTDLLPREMGVREVRNESLGLAEANCVGWINDNVLLYSTGNNIQYFVTNHNGKYEKEHICVYN